MTFLDSPFEPNMVVAEFSPKVVPLRCGDEIIGVARVTAAADGRGFEISARFYPGKEHVDVRWSGAVSL